MRTYYDDLALGAAPTQVWATKVDELSSWPVGCSSTYTVTSSTSYDTSGRVKTSTDAAGAITQFGYTQALARGPVTSTTVTNPLQQATVSTIDAARGSETSLVDANLKRTDATYDPLGRVLKAWMPGRAMATQTPSLEFVYAISATGPSSVTTKRLKDDGTYESSVQILDGLLRQIQTQAPSPTGGRLLTDTYYDTLGRVAKQNDEYYTTGVPSATRFVAVDNQVPAQTVTTYDAMGRVSDSILRGYGAEKWRTTTTYSGELTFVDPPNGQPASAEKVDALGRVVERRRYPAGSPTGTYDSTSFAFDRKGNLSTVTAPGGAQWTYTYDQLGRLARSVDPDAGSTDLTYDAAGRVESSKNALGQAIWTTYDQLGRPTSTNDTSKTGPKRTSYVYDDARQGPADVVVEVGGRQRVPDERRRLRQRLPGDRREVHRPHGRGRPRWQVLRIPPGVLAEREPAPRAPAGRGRPAPGARHVRLHLWRGPRQGDQRRGRHVPQRRAAHQLRRCLAVVPGCRGQAGLRRLPVRRRDRSTHPADHRP